MVRNSTATEATHSSISKNCRVSKIRPLKWLLKVGGGHIFKNPQWPHPFLRIGFKMHGHIPSDYGVYASCTTCGLKRQHWVVSNLTVNVQMAVHTCESSRTVIARFWLHFASASTKDHSFFDPNVPKLLNYNIETAWLWFKIIDCFICTTAYLLRPLSIIYWQSIILSC